MDGGIEGCLVSSELRKQRGATLHQDEEGGTGHGAPAGRESCAGCGCSGERRELHDRPAGLRSAALEQDEEVLLPLSLKPTPEVSREQQASRWGLGKEWQLERVRSKAAVAGMRIRLAGSVGMWSNNRESSAGRGGFWAISFSLSLRISYIN